MDFLKKHWVMVAIFAATTIAAVALIIYGVTTHTEPGLQRVCWDQQRAQYEGEPNLPCVPHEDLIWPTNQMPITITVTAESESERVQGEHTVQAAADVWNGQTGFEIFRFVESGGDAIVHWGAPFEVGHSRGSEGGWVQHRIEDGRLLADVGIIHVATNRLAYLVTIHELGHLIGLAHDSYEASPMFPITRDDSDDRRMRATVVSSWDKNVIRGIYGH